MSILALQQDARSGSSVVDGEHHDGSGVMDKVATNSHPTGFFHVIGRDPEDGTAIDGLGGNQAGFAGAARFGHGNNIKQGSRLSALGFRIKQASGLRRQASDSTLQ